MGQIEMKFETFIDNFFVNFYIGSCEELQERK